MKRNIRKLTSNTQKENRKDKNKDEIKEGRLQCLMMAGGSHFTGGKFKSDKFASCDTDLRQDYMTYQFAYRAASA